MVEFDGKPIQNLYDFTYALRGKKPGDEVKVKVTRDGKPLEVYRCAFPQRVVSGTGRRSPGRGRGESWPRGLVRSDRMAMAPERILDSGDGSLFDVQSKARGPQGSAPVTPEMLLHRPSGDLFGWTQNAGMGWDPALLGGKEFLILSTHGGIRAADGTPVALGYHTGHWEVALLMDAAAKELKSSGRGAVRGVLHGPVRRAHAGHHGDVRFPALPQRRGEYFRAADPLAAHAQRRAGRGDVRQGAAGDDDGAGRRARSAGGADSRRRDAAAGRGRGRGQGAIGGRALRPRDDHAGGRGGSHVPLLRFARRRLPVPGHGGHGAGGGRSARHVADAFGARALGPPDLAGYGAALGTCGDGGWRRAAW